MRTINPGATPHCPHQSSVAPDKSNGWIIMPVFSRFYLGKFLINIFFLKCCSNNLHMFAILYGFASKILIFLVFLTFSVKYRNLPRFFKSKNGQVVLRAPCMSTQFNHNSSGCCSGCCYEKLKLVRSHFGGKTVKFPESTPMKQLKKPTHVQWAKWVVFMLCPFDIIWLWLSCCLYAYNL